MSKKSRFLSSHQPAKQARIVTGNADFRSFCQNPDLLRLSKNMADVKALPKRERLKPEDFDNLCAIWILACNDQNAILSYKNLCERLGLEKDYVKKMIQGHRELFREGSVPNPLFRAFKGKFYPDETLGNEDVFRSQFRIGSEKKGPSPLDIMNWGLGHIERLRKAELENRAERNARLQIWTILILSFINIIVTIGLHFYEI